MTMSLLYKRHPIENALLRRWLQSPILRPTKIKRSGQRTTRELCPEAGSAA